jgi:hypothetical protein
VFPYASATKQRMTAAGKASAMDGSDSWYCQDDEEVLAAAPQAGDAVLFWDYEPGGGAGKGSFADGSAEPQAKPVPGALHSGCPVLEGQKWVRTCVRPCVWGIAPGAPSRCGVSSTHSAPPPGPLLPHCR